MTILKPTLLAGKVHNDERGVITYNNLFDMSAVKRLYTIENKLTDFVRGWQGHKIEQRWFVAVGGSFMVSVIAIDDFDNPSKYFDITNYLLNTQGLNILHIPSGYVTSIQAIEEKSKLLVMADYALGEVNDEYRFPINYFKNKL